MNKNELNIRLSLVGEECTGKTVFLKYLNYEKLYKAQHIDYIPTNGASYMIKKFIYNNKNYLFEFWDNSGNSNYRNLNFCFARESKVILIFYDSFNRKSFETAKEFVNWSREEGTNGQIYALVCNKYNLKVKEKAENIVTDEEVLEFAEKNKVLFSHISIFDKYESGVNELFVKILNEYIKNN